MTGLSPAIEDVCARRGDAIAVVDGSRVLTYRQLQREVERVSTVLSKSGVGPGRRVGLWLPNCVEWVAVALATIRLGAVLVPMNTRLREREIREVLHAAEIQLIVTTESFMSTPFLDVLERVLEPSGQGSFLMGIDAVMTVSGARAWTVAYESRPADADIAPAVDRSASDPASIFWTSGSTGSPKGVVTTHQILDHLHTYNHKMGITSADRCLASSPFFYIAGFNWNLLAPLIAGATVVITSTFTPNEILTTISGQRATVLTGIAHVMTAVVRDAGFVSTDVSSLRAVYFGGGTMVPADAHLLVETAGLDRLIAVYGLTEAGGIAAMTRADDPLEQTVATIGFALPGFEIEIRSTESGERCTGAEIGEIWIRSRFVSPYYLESSHRTSPIADSNGWFQSGDLATIAADGRIAFAGRLKDVIKVNGENVSPGEVEAVLLMCDGVEAACVVSVADELRGEVVGAAITTSRPLDADVIAEHCRSRLAPFKRPRTVLVVDELPVTASGKPSRPDVRALLSQR